MGIKHTFLTTNVYITGYWVLKYLIVTYFSQLKKLREIKSRKNEMLQKLNTRNLTPYYKGYDTSKV